MDKRAAKREAHAWVAELILGALGNGLLADFADDEGDEAKIRDAIHELAWRHQDLAGDQTLKP